MKFIPLMAATALLAATTSSVFADEKIVTDDGVATFSTFKPAQVRAEVGTTGYGGAFSWSANPYVGVTLGYNGGDVSWSDDISVNGTTYDLEMDNNLTYLNAEIRPFANWFYLAAGVGYIDNDYELRGRTAADGTIKVNGHRYQTVGATTGRVTGDLSYQNNLAPYVGLGFSPSITNRWGVFGEIGAFYNGNPDVNLNSTANYVALDPNSPTFQESLRAEEREIRNDNKYEWLPVAKLGLSFRF